MAHATAAKSTAKYIASVLEGLEDIRDRSLGRRLQAISPAARRAEGRIFLSTDAILREAHQKITVEAARYAARADSDA